MSKKSAPGVAVLGEKCYGCGACCSICPTGCLSMVEDPSGFRYPDWDSSRCISCGACDKVCPRISKRHSRTSFRKCFWAYNLDNFTRMISSSGGVFSALALAVLENNGIVYGAAYDDGRPDAVEHLRLSRSDGLSAVRGSKYLQSWLSRDIYEGIVDDLNSGHRVLFAGTACQIAAIESYVSMINVDVSNLTLVEVICHGVPSVRLWRRWLRYIEENAGHPVVGVAFRGKECGWQDYCIKYEFGNGEHIAVRHQEDWFYSKAYIGNAAMRPSCFACQVKGKSGCDILLGDFWGIDLIRPDLDASKGISAILLASNRGEELFQSAASSLCYGAVRFRDIYFGNPGILESARPYRHYTGFMLDVKSGASIEALQNKWEFKRSFFERLAGRLSRLKRRYFG